MMPACDTSRVIDANACDLIQFREASTIDADSHMRWGEAELSANEVDVCVFPSTIERGCSRSNGPRVSGDFLIEN